MTPPPRSGHRVQLGAGPTAVVLDAAAIAADAAVVSRRCSGSVVALVTEDPRLVVAALHAALVGGTLLVPLNPRMPAAELARRLDDLRPDAVCCDPATADVLPEPWRLRAVGIALAEASDAGSGDPDGGSGVGTSGDGEAQEEVRSERWPRARTPGGAPVLGLFTSGTTGRPRLAELSAEALHAAATMAWEHLGGARADDRWLACMPLFHIGGLSILTRTALADVDAVVVPWTDAERLMEVLRTEGITLLSVVPTMLARVIALGEAGRCPPTLRAVLVGGGPAGAGLIAAARALGWPALQTWGLTEACSQVTTARLDDPDPAGTAGVPLPGVRVRVAEPGPDGVGELVVRTPACMSGYRGDDDATRAKLRDGELWTGDLGRIDALGRVEIVSRREDLILSGGENVYPAEVEAVIATHPAVESCAVVGLADDEWGQVVAAAWMARAGHDTDEAALDAWARRQLARYKVPKRWMRVRELPRNASGKVLRGEIRAGFASGDAGSGGTVGAGASSSPAVDDVRRPSSRRA